MSDSKEYISKPEEAGTINISEEVVASVASIAVAEVEGVSSLTANIGTDIAEFLGMKSLAKGVKILLEDSVVAIEVFVTVKYGFAIPDVAKKIQESVLTAIESMTGLSVKCVNIHVTGIAFDKEGAHRQEK